MGKKKWETLKSRRGLTLIELMVVIVLMGLLLAVAIPKIGNAIKKSKESATRGNLGIIQSGIDLYYSDSVKGCYPNQLTYDPCSSSLPYPPTGDGEGKTLHSGLTKYFPEARLPVNRLSADMDKSRYCWNDGDGDHYVNPLGTDPNNGLPNGNNSGWFYNRWSHRVYVNNKGTDLKGTYYVEWSGVAKPPGW